MITIKVEGNNVADLWKLKCVDAIYKNCNTLKVSVKTRLNENFLYDHKFAYTGDEITIESEQSETGSVIPDYPF